MKKWFSSFTTNILQHKPLRLTMNGMLIGQAFFEATQPLNGLSSFVNSVMTINATDNNSSSTHEVNLQQNPYLMAPIITLAIGVFYTTYNNNNHTINQYNQNTTRTQPSTQSNKCRTVKILRDVGSAFLKSGNEFLMTVPAWGDVKVFSEFIQAMLQHPGDMHNTSFANVSSDGDEALQNDQAFRNWMFVISAVCALSDFAFSLAAIISEHGLNSTTVSDDSARPKAHCCITLTIKVTAQSIAVISSGTEAITSLPNTLAFFGSLAANQRGQSTEVSTIQDIYPIVIALAASFCGFLTDYEREGKTVAHGIEKLLLATLGYDNTMTDTSLTTSEITTKNNRCSIATKSFIAIISSLAEGLNSTLSLTELMLFLYNIFALSQIESTEDFIAQYTAIAYSILIFSGLNNALVDFVSEGGPYIDGNPTNDNDTMNNSEDIITADNEESTNAETEIKSKHEDVESGGTSSQPVTLVPIQDQPCNVRDEHRQPNCLYRCFRFFTAAASPTINSELLDPLRNPADAPDAPPDYDTSRGTDYLKRLIGYH